MDTASVIAYSSSANLGPGYDTLALAHNAYYNRVTVSRSDHSQDQPIRLKVRGLPTIPAENTAGLALIELMTDMSIEGKFTVSIENGIPTGLGLGSSGASAAAAVHAMDLLLGLDLPQDDQVKYAMLGEAAASGTPHADNVAASIYGGFVVVESVNPMRVRRIPVSNTFSFLTVIPEIFIKSKTKTCRELVPTEIKISDYVQGIRYNSALMTGIVTGDRELLRKGMNDQIVEEARKVLYPYYDELKAELLNLDAAGVCLSGAGPSVLAVVDEFTDTSSLMKEATKIVSRYGYNCSVVSSEIAGGATVNEEITPG